MKNERGGIIISLILIVIIIVVIGVLVDNSREIDTEKISDVSKTYYIGDTVELEDFSVKLEDVKTKNRGASIDSYKTVADPQWIAVFLTYTNKSGEEKTFYKTMRMINGSGEVIETASTYYEIWGVPYLESSTLINGGSKTGFVPFANTRKDDLKDVTLQISCKSNFDEKATFNFKLTNK